MPDRARWLPRSAWSDLHPLPPTGGIDLTVDVVEAEAMATLVARGGRERELARLVGEHLEADLPSPGRACIGRRCDIVWSAPGQWFAVAPHAAAFADLVRAAADVASVIDQSDSRGLVRIGGSCAREVLAKGFAIDLHPWAFDTGSSATTKVAHLSVQIWQVDDRPTYTIAIPRSFVGTFRAWLVQAYAFSASRPATA